jgi:hypothetical protein
VALDSAITATTAYAALKTDNDPDDGEHVVPGELRRFLARLRLLHGVPFSYLVPDTQLLPVESIRFFYIDRAWTDALTQGALSVGTVTSADRAQLQAVYPHIREEVDAAERTIRQPEGEPPLQGAAGTITGFLLRSRVVSGWPNLHVRAYSRDILEDDALTTEAESSPERLKVLRLERLAPAVLLVLIDGTPAVVHIEEPRQGLQFGVRLDKNDPPAARKAKVKIRDNNNGNPVPPKTAFTTSNSIDVPFRRNASGVLDVRELKKRLQAKALAHIPPGTPTAGNIKPNELALQMLRFPFRQVFGDPRDTAGLHFYDIDKFKVTLAMSDLQKRVAGGLVQP